MTALIIATSLLLAHVTGAIAIVAPVIGNVGTIVAGIDKTVTGAIDLRKIVSASKPMKHKHRHPHEWH